ncbi:Uncharacterised protein [Mycoplasmopsis pulmonis]|nr:Uncharacterised protein [Mycoplasmopsis pulmonis]
MKNCERALRSPSPPKNTPHEDLKSLLNRSANIKYVDIIVKTKIPPSEKKAAV